MNNQKQILNELVEIVRIDSTTANHEGVHAVVEKLQAFLADLPLKWERFSSEGSADFVVARSQEADPTRPTVLLSGHVDTVFPPKDVRIEGGVMHGAGTQDMKGGLMVIVDCLRSLHKNNELRNIILALNPEEEKTRSREHKQLMRSLAKEAEYIMVFESTLDTAPDAPAHHRSVVTRRKGMYAFTVTIEGPGGHAGVIVRKSQRKNVLFVAARLINRLARMQNFRKGLLVNVGRMSCPGEYNAIAANVEFEGEVRFWRMADFQHFKQKLEEAIALIRQDEAYTVTLQEKGPVEPLQESKATQEFYDIVQTVAKKQSIQLTEEARGGRSDACTFQDGNPDAGILDGFGVRGDGQHSESEYVTLESIFTSSQFAYEVIRYIRHER